MMIICTRCRARYLISPDDIGDHGRKVRCTQCAHVWFQEKVSDIEESDEQDPEGEVYGAEESLDTLVQEAFHTDMGSDSVAHFTSDSSFFMKWRVWILGAMITTLFLFGMSLLYADQVQRKWFSARDYYRFLGFGTTEGLVLKDLSAGLIMNRNDTKDLLFSGSIINVHLAPRTLPSMRIMFLDDAGKTLKTVFLRSSPLFDGQGLEPGAAMRFSNRIPGVPMSAFRMVVDIGNPLEIFLR